MQQTTIQRPFTCSGIGVHSGKQSHIIIKPAPADSGITFEVVVNAKKYILKPSPSAVIATKLSTTLGNDSVCVKTVEHLLSAVRGLHIDNIHICVYGGEIPIMDGSAKTFAEKILQAGTVYLPNTKKILQITHPIEINDNGKYIKALPYNGLFIDYTIQFPHPIIGRQNLALKITPKTYMSIAHARTFGFLKNVEQMKRQGLALGGSLKNAIVLDEKTIINQQGLRYPDEFVRHKMLDFIGDIAMMSLPIHGYFEVYCSGHQLNNSFLHLAKKENALITIELNSITEKCFSISQTTYDDSIAIVQ